MNVKVIDVHLYDYVLVVVVEYVIKSLVSRKKTSLQPQIADWNRTNEKYTSFQLDYK